MEFKTQRMVAKIIIIIQTSKSYSSKSVVLKYYLTHVNIN